MLQRCILRQRLIEARPCAWVKVISQICFLEELYPFFFQEPGQSAAE